MSICIQEVEDTMKELNERNQIYGVLVRALSSHASAEDRAKKQAHQDRSPHEHHTNHK